MNYLNVSGITFKKEVKIQHTVHVERERCSHPVLQSGLTKFLKVFAELEDIILYLGCISYCDWKEMFVSV